ncbi:hypothetical protein ES705_25073 [subsurface metagenome]
MRPHTEGLDYDNLVIPWLPEECPPFLRDLSVIVVEPVVLVYQSRLGIPAEPQQGPYLGYSLGFPAGELVPQVRANSLAPKVFLGQAESPASG